jgi:hypothetical protein
VAASTKRTQKPNELRALRRSRHGSAFDLSNSVPPSPFPGRGARSAAEIDGSDDDKLRSFGKIVMILFSRLT